MKHPTLIRHLVGRTTTIAVAAIAALAATAGSVQASAQQRHPNTLVVLQVDLCDSGYQWCYKGGAATTDTAALVATHKPQVLTANGACAKDGDQLLAAVRAARPADESTMLFQQVTWADGTAATCRNGQPYGNAVVVSLPKEKFKQFTPYTGAYTAQMGHVEQRGYACVHAVGQFFGCTTALAEGDPATALAQCKELTGTVLPGMRGTNTGEPIYLGGVTQLPETGDGAAMKQCLPADYRTATDGRGEYVTATDTPKSIKPQVVTLPSTDHPVLVAEVAYH